MALRLIRLDIICQTIICANNFLINCIEINGNQPLQNNIFILPNYHDFIFRLFPYTTLTTAFMFSKFNLTLQQQQQQQQQQHFRTHYINN